jgi:hypothetical protein
VLSALTTISGSRFAQSTTKTAFPWSLAITPLLHRLDNTALEIPIDRVMARKDILDVQELEEIERLTTSSMKKPAKTCNRSQSSPPSAQSRSNGSQSSQG